MPHQGVLSGQMGNTCSIFNYPITQLPIYQILLDPDRKPNDRREMRLSGGIPMSPPQGGAIIEPRPSGLGTESKRNLPLCRRPSRSAKRGATRKDRSQWSGAVPPLQVPRQPCKSSIGVRLQRPHLATVNEGSCGRARVSADSVLLCWGGCVLGGDSGFAFPANCQLLIANCYFPA